jgi:iron-sulfur cluster repair protein YtfE (RIC family)
MLISIGRRTEPDDLVGLLLDCHERIRRFSSLAERAGTSHEHSAAEIAEACRQCERYFREALPLHVDDEEQSILPRLQGKSASLDDALAMMHSQHQTHGPTLDALLRALAGVAERPEDQGLRDELRAIASQVVSDFEEHLGLEETIIFPAIAAELSVEARADIMKELRARRATPPAAD